MNLLVRIRNKVAGAAVCLAACMMSVLTLGSCRESARNAEDIYRNDASGVVLIKNSYYYVMSLGGEVVYFTGVDADGNLQNVTESIDEASKNSATAFGTGFFVARDGSILTNRHVVRPQIDDSAVKSGLFRQLNNVRAYYAAMHDAAAQQYNELYLRRAAGLISSGPLYGDVDETLRELDTKIDRYREAAEKIENINVDDVRITSSCRIAVAYGGSEGDLANSFENCNVVKVSGIEDVDLALIRLATKQTPKNRYIFHFAGELKGKRTLLETYWRRLREDKEGRKLRPGTQLCMIGYNHGPQLAQTAKGLKAQISTGNVLQEPDGERLLYSIPLLEGSSGSPVLNMYGDVVGVNYAKTRGTTSFNFGIPADKAKQFLGIK